MKTTLGPIMRKTHRRYPLAIIILAAAVGISVWWWTTRPAPVPSTPPLIERPPASGTLAADDARQRELEQQYRDQVVGTFRTIPSAPGVAVSYAEIRERLLELTVPGKYRQLHLDIVVALDSIARGQSAPDQGLLEAGFEQLQAIAGREPWLQPLADLPASP